MAAAEAGAGIARSGRGAGVERQTERTRRAIGAEIGGDGRVKGMTMNESDLMAITILLILTAGLVIGYLFGKYDQRGWLAEQYKIACWQRDQAISQRDRLAELIEEHRRNVERIWNNQN